MLTPEAVAEKTFRKTMFGYDLEQVDAFLDEIILQMQQQEKERREMADMIDLLSARLQKYESESARSFSINDSEKQDDSDR